MKRGVATIAALQWLLGGAGTIIASIAFAYTNATSTNIKTLSDTVAGHTTEISQLKDSACVQNSNIQNIAAAVHASFVPDPHCK